MVNYLKIISTALEYPTMLGGEHIKTSFHFNIAYARHSYFIGQDLFYSRQNFLNKYFLLELFQCALFRRAHSGFGLNDYHLAFLFAVKGTFNIRAQKGQPEIRIRSGECKLVLLEPADYFGGLDRSGSGVLFIGMRYKWFIETFRHHPELKKFVAALLKHGGQYHSLPQRPANFAIWRTVICLFNYFPANLDDLDRYMIQTVTELINQYAKSLLQLYIPVQERLDKIGQYVLNSIKRQKVIPSASELAYEFGFSERNLQRHCKQLTGKTVVEHINEIRMNEAYKLLSNRQQNITKISNLLIYRTRKYFVAEFKKRYSVHPAAIYSKKA